MSLEKKVVIITGAASGIGRACAQRFAKEKAKVVLADIDEKKGEALAKDMSERGDDVRFVHCNVSERLDIRNLLAHTMEAYGEINVLINNAGIVDNVHFLDLSEDEFMRVFDVNLRGAFLVGQAVAKQMVEQVKEGKEGKEENGSCSIINMSSVNSVFGFADHVAYAVSKGGIQQLTKSMALALAPYNIRVNAIGPGSIMTPILEKVAEDEDAMKMILSRTPLGRVGRPSEIAAVAAFLASDEASYITGETIFADAGRLALNYLVSHSESNS